MSSALPSGARGCGAFGNDPTRTAEDFREALEHEFDGVFTEVVFAITDWSEERRVFEAVTSFIESTAVLKS